MSESLAPLGKRDKQAWDAIILKRLVVLFSLVTCNLMAIFKVVDGWAVQADFDTLCFI
jgi:hypothetical protein